jgi:hypothetical protein
MKDDITTEKDVSLDVEAALDMYEGTMGSETTTIEKIALDARDNIVLVLSDGSEYRLTVRQIR